MFEVTRSRWPRVLPKTLFAMLLTAFAVFMLYFLSTGKWGIPTDGFLLGGLASSLWIVLFFSDMTLSRRWIVAPDSMTMQWVRRGRVTQEIVYTIPRDARVVVDTRLWWYQPVVYILDPATEKIDRFFVVQQGFRVHDAKEAGRVLRNAETGLDAANELAALIKKPGVDNIGDSLFRLDGELYEDEPDYD